MSFEPEWRTYTLAEPWPSDLVETICNPDREVEALIREIGSNRGIMPGGRDPLHQPPRETPCDPVKALSDSFDGPAGEAKAHGYLKRKAGNALRTSMKNRGKRSDREIEEMVKKLGFE